jgi:hypothetical protein
MFTVSAFAACWIDVHGVGLRRVLDVVLRGGRQDLQPDVARADRAQLELVELDHARDVHLVVIAARALGFLGNRIGGDRIRACLH